MSLNDLPFGILPLAIISSKKLLTLAGNRMIERRKIGKSGCKYNIGFRVFLKYIKPYDILACLPINICDTYKIYCSDKLKIFVYENC